MKSQVLLNFPMTYLTSAALLIFFTFFVLMVVRTWSRSRHDELNRASQLPLEEGSHHGE